MLSKPNEASESALSLQVDQVREQAEFNALVGMDALVRQEIRDLRITLNSRLATAAAAMVQRIIIRSIPRVFLPPSPFKKGSKPVVAMLNSKKAAFAPRFF